MTTEDEADEPRLVGELQQAWIRGTPPSALVRSLRAKGMGGARVIIMMQQAFALSLGKTNAITAWFSDGDDERLDRFLIPHMPDRHQPEFTDDSDK